ncbi:MAG: phosphatase PAP2 family protein, partial [Acidimicrobiia bacterium]
DFTELRPPGAARDLAILHTGLYDAMVASYDTKRANRDLTRPAPEVLEPKLKPTLKSPKSTYVPVQATMAGAAEKLLAFLNPSSDPAVFEAMADEAVESRLWAGVAYRSDVESARLLGNQVAAAVIEHVKTDNSTAVGFIEPRPSAGQERAVASGDGDTEKQWQPTPSTFESPVGGPVGMWRPWVIPSGSALTSVIPGPPVYGSPEFLAEVHEVIEVSETLTESQGQTAFFWDDAPGSHTPSGHWFEIATDVALDYKLSTKETARAFALLGAAEADASIAFFAAKYHWWSIRPISVIWRLCNESGVERLCTDSEAEALYNTDPARVPYWNEWFALIETPPFPSYPGGHSTFSGAAGKVLTYLVPEAGETLNQLAEEAAMSRLYGGIHFHSDNRDGLILGRTVADYAIEWAETDGSGL